MKHWLAWNPDDTDRSGARSYWQRDGVCDADDAAVAHAESEWDGSAGEVGHEFTVAVVEVADDGSETNVVFDISVEYEPTFSATPKEIP